MKAEIKYIALLYLANMLSLPFLTMLFAWDYRPAAILPMVILGSCTATVSLWVGMRWMRVENVVFLTKDTLINGVKRGAK